MKFRWGNRQLTLSDETPSDPQPSVPPKKEFGLHWRQELLILTYARCIQEFESHGFSMDDIKRLRVEELSAKEFKTSSDRIKRMIITAYYVGKMRGIRESDGAFIMISPSGKEVAD